MRSTMGWWKQPWLLHLFVLVLIVPNKVSSQAQSASTLLDLKENPTISLRAGIFHAPPYVFLEEQEDDKNVTTLGSPFDRNNVHGFCIDLLQRLQVFALEMDNVILDFQLIKAPQSYNGALDWIANDCTTIQVNDTDKCDKLDLVATDYYGTPDRAMRIEYSPPWLQGGVTTVQYVPKESNMLDDGETAAVEYESDGRSNNLQNIVTMTQASQQGLNVCLVADTVIVAMTQTQFPGANYVLCPTNDDCIQQLKAGNCQLFVDDQLQLKYKAVQDPTLLVSDEEFIPQYNSWIMRDSLDPLVLRLMKRWMHAANQNGTLTQLYQDYFEKEPCPRGRAGANCELPCSPDHGQADAQGNCICQSARWTGPACTEEVPEELNLIPTSLKAMAYTLFSINMVVIMGCALWLVCHRQSRQVVLSQPSFLLLVLLGCAISTSAILALAQESAGDGPVHSCMAIPWLYSVGFCVTFGTLFAKIRRVYILFKSSAHMKRVQVGWMENFVMIGSILLVDVTILICWSVLDPLKWHREVILEDQYGIPLESEGYCTSDHWLAFASAIATLHLILLLTASCMCYVSRHIPTKFSEGKFVSIAMVSNLQIFIVGLPILVVVGSDPAASFFVRSVMVWMNDLAVVTLIFGNLIYSVSIRHVDEDMQVKDEIREAIQSFSRHQDDDDMNISLHSAISVGSNAVKEVVRVSNVLLHPNRSNSSIPSGSGSDRISGLLRNASLNGHGSSHSSADGAENHDLRAINASWQQLHGTSKKIPNTAKGKQECCDQHSSGPFSTTSSMSSSRVSKHFLVGANPGSSSFSSVSEQRTHNRNISGGDEDIPDFDKMDDRRPDKLFEDMILETQPVSKDDYRQYDNDSHECDACPSDSNAMGESLPYSFQPKLSEIEEIGENHMKAPGTSATKN